MTTLSDPAQGSFNLSMLINDTRYRSYTFQALALILLIFAASMLLSNLFANLAAQGLNISYDFLWAPAGYDINQRPIEYDSQSSNMRASVVGAINTLIVAFLACVSATIIGVIAGVLRLSDNWIIARLMSLYVEAFRNVPVLIWIIVIFTITTSALPQPSAFRGDEPTASMLFGSFAFTNRGVFTPAPVFAAGGWAVVGVFLISIAGVFWWRARVKKVLYDTGKILPTFFPSLGILIIPTLIAYFVLGSPITLEYPELKGFNFKGGLNIRGSLIALWFALAIYTGAFIAENVRAGILAVSKGQTEAAAALGMRPGRIMNLVVLPQALRVIIP
ncbi:MAG: ABC transporter permease subunit, partial [Roseibium sp.]